MSENSHFSLFVQGGMFHFFKITSVLLSGRCFLFFRYLLTYSPHRNFTKNTVVCDENFLVNLTWLFAIMHS